MIEARLQKNGETWIRVLFCMHDDGIDEFWNVRENRLFGGVRNFQQDSTNQTGAGPLEYRAPDPGVPIAWFV